jgi:hypothetical protein
VRAHFRTLRRWSCRALGHTYSAVLRRWYWNRYPGLLPAHIRATNVRGLVACMDCGDVLKPLFIAPGAIVYDPDYPTWLPERLRHDQPCPLCQLLTYDPCWARCSACGVTEEQLFQAGIATASHSPPRPLTPRTPSMTRRRRS